MEQELIEQIERVVGHRFADASLLVRALRHASVCDSRLESNERLEFLGDSVLGLVACRRIFQRYPHLLEGDMTKIKSATVSRRTCARIAKEVGLDPLLVIGKGMQSSATMPSSLAAAVLESIIGALYLDGGIDAAERFIGPLLDPVIARAEQSGHQHNFKSVLQQHAQDRLGRPPTYRTLDEKGPDHAKCFKVAVEVGERRFEGVWGASKKQAEQNAALAALRELGRIVEDEDGEVRVVEMPDGNGSK